MGAALGYGFVGGIIASAAVAMAYYFVAASEYPTNVGKSHLYIYNRGKAPLTEQKIRSYDYAIYYGKDVFLGTSETIKKSCVGCGV